MSGSEPSTLQQLQLNDVFPDANVSHRLRPDIKTRTTEKSTAMEKIRKKNPQKHCLSDGAAYQIHIQFTAVRVESFFLFFMGIIFPTTLEWRQGDSGPQ